MSYQEIKEFASPIFPNERERLGAFLCECSTDVINALYFILFALKCGGTLTRGEAEFFTAEEWEAVKNELSPEWKENAPISRFYVIDNKLYYKEGEN